MRFLRLLLCDIRYQFKYGFYLVYAVVSTIYIGILLMLPAEIRQQGAAIIIWSDPAALGFLFIGGIVLLEKGEGLHGYFAIAPIKVSEYVLAKALSLSVISTLAGLFIAAVGLGAAGGPGGEVSYSLLVIGLVAGSAVFTLFGLAVGSMARSVNHYLAISVPVMIVLIVPSVLAAFGVTHPLLEVLPATLLLRVLYYSVGLAVPFSGYLALAGLLLWLLPSFWLAWRRFALYLYPPAGSFRGGV